MASSFTIRIKYDGEFKAAKAFPSSLDYLEAGDTVTFSGSGVTITGFSSSCWTSSANISGGSTKTVKSGVPNTTDYVSATVNGKTVSIPLRFRVGDKYPDSFGLSNMSNIDPKALVTLPVINVSGINKGVQAKGTTSDGGLVNVFVNSVNNAPRSYTLVENGDKVYFQVEAARDYMQSVTVTIAIGTRSQTITLANRRFPLVDQMIKIGVTSVPIAFKSQVVNFFGSKSSEPKLTDYLRGNDLVPSIEQNEHVPTSPPIELTDLLDTASALYFRYRPASKRIGADTTSSAQTRSLVWDIENEYNVGYGELAKELEYRYVVTRDDSNSGLSINTATSTSHSSWSQGNRYISLTASSGTKAVEKHFRGSLTIYVRNAVDHSLVISTTVDWAIFFYGP